MRIKSVDDNFKKNSQIVGPYDSAVAASCINGVFVGKNDDGVVAFKGIPFAEPPVGELRWKSPVSVSRKDEVFEAFYNGASPLQSRSESERASLFHQSEDCLYLNIWTAGKYAGEKRPVMVFIHGGAYGWGGTADPLYDGHNFVKNHPDIVLVTITYRLGILGFMDFSGVPGGEDYKTGGNLGLLDQVEALRYIKKNISSFGGDAENVTIFGESAGGGSVSLLPLIPEAKGLFKRVIAESGSLSLTYSPGECMYLTDKLMKKTGAHSMEDLCALSEEQLKKVIDRFDDTNYPERDGVVLPQDLYGAYKSGEASHVDMIIGTNKDEMRYWIKDIGGLSIYKICAYYMFENDSKKLGAGNKKRTKRFFKKHKEKNPLKTFLKKPWVITDLYNEIIFRLPAIRQSEHQSDNGGKVYMYFWKYPSKHPHLGACHAVELAYVFGNLSETIYSGENINAELSEKVQNMWANFARTGNPSIEGAEWEPYSSENRFTMLLDDPISVGKDIRRYERKLLMPLTDNYYNGNHKEHSANIPFVYRNLFALTAFVAGGIGLLHLIRTEIKKRSSK